MHSGNSACVPGIVGRTDVRSCDWHVGNTNLAHRWGVNLQPAAAAGSRSLTPTTAGLFLTYTYKRKFWSSAGKRLKQIDISVIFMGFMVKDIRADLKKNLTLEAYLQLFSMKSVFNNQLFVFDNLAQHLNIYNYWFHNQIKLNNCYYSSIH